MKLVFLGDLLATVVKSPPVVVLFIKGDIIESRVT